MSSLIPFTSQYFSDALQLLRLKLPISRTAIPALSLFLGLFVYSFTDLYAQSSALQQNRISLDEGYIKTDTLLWTPSNKHQLVKVFSGELFYGLPEGVYLRKTVLDFESLRTNPILVPIERQDTLNAVSYLDTLRVFVEDLNEPPIFDQNQNTLFTLPENINTSVFIGRIRATDPDTGLQTLIYFVEPNEFSQAFSMRGDSLFADGPSPYFNFERFQPPIIPLTITVSDSLGLNSQQLIQIELLDEPEAPTALIWSTNFIDENPEKNQLLAKIQVEDEDFNESFSFDLNTSNTHAIRYEKQENELHLFVKDTAFFNYEERQALYIELSVEDKNKLSFSERIRFDIQDVNEAPQLLLPDSLLLVEDVAPNSMAFMVSDPESFAHELDIEFGSPSPFLLSAALSYQNLFSNADSLIAAISTGQNTYGRYWLSVGVSDGEFFVQDTTQIIIQAINDLPQANVKPLRLKEGSTQDISHRHLAVRDVDNSVQQLKLIVHQEPKYGQLFLQNNPINSGYDVEYLQIMTNNLSYRHAGKEQHYDTWSFFLTDGLDTTEAFIQEILIDAVNDPPTIVTPIREQIILEDQNGEIRISIDDVDSPLNEIAMAVSSTNQGILPDENIQVFGQDRFRTIRFTPNANRNGTLNLDIHLFDAQDTTYARIPITIVPVNDAPLLQADKKSYRFANNGIHTVTIQYNDPDHDTKDLSLSIESDNPLILPNSILDIQNDTENGSILIAFDATKRPEGQANLHLRLSDGHLESQLIIPIEIYDENDPPSAFQLIQGESFIRNDSLIAAFEWTPSIDPEGKSVEYHLFIQSTTLDTVIKNLKSTAYEWKTAGRFLQPESRYQWYVKATDNHHIRSGFIDSTKSQDEGQFITPYFEQSAGWAQLLSIFPNPFRVRTTIEYSLERDAEIQLAIYDLGGRVIDRIASGLKSKGRYTIDWTPPSGSSGMYISQLVAVDLNGNTIRLSKNLTYLPN